MEKSFFNIGFKRYAALFAVALIIGTVFANFSGIEKIRSWNIFSPAYVDRIINTKISFTGMLVYTLKSRAVLFAFVMVAAFTRLRIAVSYVLLAYAGLASGIIMSALSMQYGARYLPVFLVCIFLHMLVYSVGVFYIYSRRNVMKQCIMGGLIILGGILLETIINYFLLSHIVLILI